MPRIRHMLEMTSAEYLDEQRRSQIQQDFARKIKYDRTKVPADMLCYHGNLLLSCESINCFVDSGRMESRNRA